MPEMISLDTETELFGPGNMAPKPVVASFFDGAEGWFERFLNAFDDDCAEETIEGVIFRPGVVVAGANFAYDGAVCARRVPRWLKLLFDLYERGQIWDVEIVAALDAIAEGRMTDGMVLNRNMEPLRKFGDTGPVTNRFSLSNCVWLYKGRLDAKANDEFRLSYGELGKLPKSQWPEKAKIYPVDDARNTYEVAAVQRGLVPGVPRAQNTGQIGEQFDATPLLPNTTWPTFQARAAWAMHLGTVWGFRTDPERIAAIEKKITTSVDLDALVIDQLKLERHTDETGKARDQVARPYLFSKFREWGFLKNLPGKKDDGKENRAGIKREVAIAYGSAPESKCKKCGGTGKMSSEKTGKPVQCKDDDRGPGCDATGLDIAQTVPRTPSDGIATDRDTLDGTGNPRLEAWAEAGKTDKMIETYLPWLKQGVDTPINVRSNVLVASGRCSYDGLVQLIPPGARECIKARAGYVFCSTDYPSLELCTLAQATFWVLGYSRMREAINLSGDPGYLHTEFGAKMAGVDVANEGRMAEFKKLAEDKGSAEYRFRFMAKAANFGFPGGMGAPKLVLTKRKEGLYFCVASGLNKVCKPGVMEWKGKPLSKPTCPDCIDVAAKLREDWFQAWPEIKPYFQWVTTIDGIDDGHGKLVTPGTGFVRGGLNFTSAANHSFQHIGACAAKHAFWLISKEAYTDERSPLWGTRPLVLVHDEAFSEMPRVGMLAAGWRTAEIMRDALRIFCPDIKVPLPEPAFCEYWYKKATLLRDKATGQPIDAPWVPTDKAGNPVAWKP